MPLTTYFRSKYNFAPGDFPVTDQVFARALTLPLHEGLTETEQHTVVTRLCALLSSDNG
jgi:dTDP-4-amino-4,6-dideoxygalactose transaminase